MSTENRPEISRRRPGLFLFLIDQSASMADPFRGSEHTKAEAVALTVNTAIHNLILNCMPYGEVDDYYHFGAIGYGGHGVNLVFGGDLDGLIPVPASSLAEHPLRQQQRVVVVDGEERRERHLVWIDPTASGMTPMCEAIGRATEVIADWANDFAESIPPIVMNVTDGEANDGDPRIAAKQLMATGTGRGTTMFFNLQLTSDPGAPVLYPANQADLPDRFGRALFDMSSTLPTYMVSMANALDLPVPTGARGLVYNGDMTSLVHFLTIGTTPAQIR